MKRTMLILSIFLLATLISGWVNLAGAQQAGKVYRMGVLISAAPGVATEPFLDGFRQGLRELGYVEGKNFVLEIRWGEAKRDRLPNLAAELVRLKVDIIVAAGGWAEVPPHPALRRLSSHPSRRQRHAIPFHPSLSSTPGSRGSDLDRFP